MDIDFLKLFQESKSHLELGMSKDIQAFFEGRGDVKNYIVFQKNQAKSYF